MHRQRTAAFSPLRRVLPCLVATCVFALMAALYLRGDRHLYHTILIGWGVRPFAFAFVDTDTVLSAVRCLRAGIDVFAANPCDVLARVYDYSPLWLVLARLPVTTAWIAPAGLAIVGAFLLSLLLLPVARGRAEMAVLIAGILSSGVAFAVERGNNDLVLFVLAAVAAALACRTPALRMVGYAAALLAGLLKYYPMTLMLLATRERPGRFLAVAAASVAVLLVFLATMGHDLVRALQLIPVGSWYGDMFGSSTLAGGLAAEYHWPGPVALALRLAMTLVALAIGAMLGLRGRITAALGTLVEGERMFLLAGSLLVLGCFFTAQNIGYRVVHLVLVLPALTALWRLDRRPLWGFATVAALALLWAQGWRIALVRLTGSNMLGAAAWLLREALWWGLVTILIGCVISLTTRSTMGRWLLHRSANDDRVAATPAP